MRCYCNILHISYKDHVTNEEIRAKIQQAIGPHGDLMTIVKRRKLQCFGHISRSTGLAKTILQGTVKGGRRQGTQRKRWEDNIREWTGVEFAKSERAVENRERWTKLVVKSSLVPKRSSRVKGSMMMMMMMVYFHISFGLPCLLPPFTAPCKMVFARLENMSIPLKFASLYEGQVFVWSDCLLDLGTDFFVGNMVFE